MSLDSNSITDVCFYANFCDWSFNQNIKGTKLFEGRLY